jgi:acylphosphatase
MTKEAALARRVIVEGFVQGVGYREFARLAAIRLRISGWIQNLTDGSVEAFISGAPADIEAMLVEMRRGPRGANVTNIRFTELAETEAPASRGFVVRSTA